MCKPGKKISKGKLKNRTDRLLQSYIKLKYDNCWVCESPIDCGHHFFTKANSNALRYYLPNIIPLCRACHCKAHTQPHLVNPRICFIMGQDWYENLVEVNRQGVKANMQWYQFRFEEMQGLYEEAKRGREK